MDPWMADRMADPDSWEDMVDDWMGEPAGVLCEVDDNLRALDAHADPASLKREICPSVLADHLCLGCS